MTYQPSTNMHIAYSALRTTKTQNQLNNHELLLRCRAYQATCQKYSSQIAAIQKYLPGWAPKPPTASL